MSNINTVALSGNLSADPELRHTANGTAVANLRMAVNRSRKDPAGDGYIEEVSYFDVTVWSGYGELCAKKLSKGSPISVQGRLEQRRWEAEDGTKRSAVSIVADQVDGPDFYKAGGETPAPAQQEIAAPAAAGDDDIPF